MAYIETKEGSKRGSKTVYSGSNPKKNFLSEQISFGTGKKNKQSPGFFDMAVDYIKKAFD